MDNNINFKGLKNIGACTLSIDSMPANVRRHNLLINLTNDLKGKDLTEFQNVVKKCEPEADCSRFPLGGNFVHIMTSVIEDGKDIPELAVNWQRIIPSRKTLPIFSYIAKLTRRIAAMPDNEFVYNQDFKYGPDGDMFIIPGNKISEGTEGSAQLKRAMDNIYSSRESKKMAKQINSDIQMQMEDYLG